LPHNKKCHNTPFVLELTPTGERFNEMLDNFMDYISQVSDSPPVYRFKSSVDMSMLDGTEVQRVSIKLVNFNQRCARDYEEKLEQQKRDEKRTRIAEDKRVKEEIEAARQAECKRVREAGLDELKAQLPPFEMPPTPAPLDGSLGLMEAMFEVVYSLHSLNKKATKRSDGASTSVFALRRGTKSTASAQAADPMERLMNEWTHWKRDHEWFLKEFDDAFTDIVQYDAEMVNPADIDSDWLSARYIKLRSLETSRGKIGDSIARMERMFGVLLGKSKSTKDDDESEISGPSTEAEPVAPATSAGAGAATSMLSLLRRRPTVETTDHEIPDVLSPTDPTMDPAARAPALKKSTSRFGRNKSDDGPAPLVIYFPGAEGGGGMPPPPGSATINGRARARSQKTLAGDEDKGFFSKIMGTVTGDARLRTKSATSVRLHKITVLK
jgi:hypothetical protein